MKQQFQFRVQNTQGIKALNKPITLLYLIGQYYHLEKTEFSFAELEPIIGTIIKDYTGNPNILDPFYRLSNDGILVFPEAKKIRRNKSGGVSTADMRQYGIAHFSKEFEQYIKKPENLVEYCESILESYFAESLEEDILFRTALDYRQNYLTIKTKQKRKRDPKFRETVATAYNQQCAVCGFNLMLGSNSIANEAAHIKWHAYDGPDTVANGLLLCNLHHNLFDRGVFTFSEKYRMSVSDKVSSFSDGFKRWLLDYEDKEIMLPRKSEWVPNQDYLNWHRKNVYIS